MTTLAPAPAWYEPPDELAAATCEGCGKELRAGDRAYDTPNGLLCGDCLVSFAEDYVIDRGIALAAHLNACGELE